MHGLQEIIAMNGNSEEDLDRGNAFDVVGPQPGSDLLDELRRQLQCSINVAPTLDNVREYVAKGLQSFLNDHPDSAHQRGYLSALLAVAKEAFKEDMSAAPYAPAERILNHLAAPGSNVCPDGTEAWGPWSNWPRACASR